MKYIIIFVIIFYSTLLKSNEIFGDFFDNLRTKSENYLCTASSYYKNFEKVPSKQNDIIKLKLSTYELEDMGDYIGVKIDSTYFYNPWSFSKKNDWINHLHYIMHHQSRQKYIILNFNLKTNEVIFIEGKQSKTLGMTSYPNSISVINASCEIF